MRFIDPDLLHTFVAFVDAGTLARAAAVVGRSPSAVTAQMQRLEEIVGEPLLAASGRGRALTPAGQEFVLQARRILEVHREAWLTLKGARADGRMVIGATQDFSDTILPDLLRVFARTHQRMRLDVRIGRSVELTRALDDGAADVVVVMRQEPHPHDVGVLPLPMRWAGPETALFGPDEEVPLALLDPPCGFRAAAIAALEVGHRPYRIAATSSSLSGLRTAVLAGLAITPRTSLWLGDGIAEMPADHGLPGLPEAVFAVRCRRDAPPSARAFAELLCDGLGMAAPGSAQAS